MLKRIFIISFSWCTFYIISGTILLFLNVIEAGGFIPLVNPLALFFLSYWFYLIATSIHIMLNIKLSLNKWLTASIGVFALYLIISIPLILDGDYFEELDWKVILFLLTHIILLIFFDKLFEKVKNSKFYKNNLHK